MSKLTSRAALTAIHLPVEDDSSADAFRYEESGAHFGKIGIEI